MFASCRFAHYLKCIVRDKIGSFKERADMQRWLNNWIMNYVDGDPANSSETTKAHKPTKVATRVCGLRAIDRQPPDQRERGPTAGSTINDIGNTRQ